MTLIIVFCIITGVCLLAGASAATVSELTDSERTVSVCNIIGLFSTILAIISFTALVMSLS